MARILLLVKKSPQQVGYGLLQTFDRTRSRETHEESAAKLRTEASLAAFKWRMCYSGWRFRIVDPRDYGAFGTYMYNAYYDDVQQRVEQVA